MTEAERKELTEMGMSTGDIALLAGQMALGYKRLTPNPTGKNMGAELSDHCGYTGHTAKAVWVNDRATYAYVWQDDNKWAHGCWHLFENGDFSLA